MNFIWNFDTNIPKFGANFILDFATNFNFKF